MTDLVVRQSLDHCIKCTICETACPVARATPLFPGPKYAGPQAERFRTGDGGPSVDASVDYCSGCGICTQVCPQDVKIAEINARARAALKAQAGVRWRDKLIARPGLLGRLGSPVAPVANRALHSRWARAVVEVVVGVHRSAPMPAFAMRPFASRYRRRRPGDVGEARAVVAYFHGCSINWFEPGLGEKAVAVLERNGVAVRVPRQGCCGLPLQSNGLFDDARRHLRRQAAALVRDVRAGHPVVATSTSCGLMLKREGRDVLGLEDDENVAAVGRATYDVCEFLLGLHEDGRLDTGFQPVDLTVAYHAPCQQRGHGMGTPALDLLALIPGLRVIELQADCCGIAGTYGLKKEKYAIAQEVGRPLFGAIRGAAPDLVVCDSETCRWQITAAAQVPSVHPVELLYRAYGLP